MKKKIIGIILTLTMVLTMLPALALPTKAEDSLPGTIKITKGGASTTIGKDYSVEDNIITIHTDGCTVSGSATDCKIVIGSSVKHLTIKDLKLDYSKEFSGQSIYKGSDSELEIIIKGENQLGNSRENLYLVTGIVVDRELTITGDGTLTIFTSEDGINGGNNISIKDVTLEIYSGGGGAIEAKDDLTISGSAKIEVSSERKSDGDSGTINASNITIEGKADVSSIANSESALKGNADGIIKISSSGSIKLSSKEFSALSSGRLVIDKNVNDLVLYGAFKMDEVLFAGAVRLYEEPKSGDISDKLIIYGGVNVEPTFNPKDIMKEENKAEIKKMEQNEEEPKEPKKFTGKATATIYTCFVEDEVANALVIRNIEEPTTPENNPKTGDTNSMILWIVLGLASLSVAAGILLSKKQKN